jgi:hypothetical protein
MRSTKYLLFCGYFVLFGNVADKFAICIDSTIFHLLKISKKAHVFSIFTIDLSAEIHYTLL